MMGIEPVTRKEMFMAAAAGESVTALTPVTREEYFLSKIAGSGGGSGGGTDGVYVIKQVNNYDTQAVELHGDYAGAVAALDSGKSLKFVVAAFVGGKEHVFYESFSYSPNLADSEIKFVCYNGYNFMTYILTESGINNLGDDTHVNSLYIDIQGSLFLKSSTEGSNKLFRVSVSDTGELSTEEVT